MLAVDLALEETREDEGALVGELGHRPPSFPLLWVDRITEQLARSESQSIETASSVCATGSVESGGP